MNGIPTLQESNWQGAVFLTGGGASLLAGLLAEPGASKTVLDAQVPYSPEALSELLGGRPDQACSAPCARAMAMSAFERAVRLGATRQAAFGFGLTASVATNRPKRGAFRAHMALQTATSTAAWRLELPSGDRPTHETLIYSAGLSALLYGLGLAGTENVAGASFELASAEQEEGTLYKGAVEFVGVPGPAILSGSFNPLHSGHRAMRDLAEKRLGVPVCYELCIRGLDKPPMDYISLHERLRQFGSEAIVLTRLPRFVQKAEALKPEGGLCFVVGVDTLTRIGSPSYYAGGDLDRDRAVARLAERRDRFLVFGRAGRSGRFESLHSARVPSLLRSLCQGVGESDFRLDLSSTEIREQLEPSAAEGKRAE